MFRTERTVASALSIAALFGLLMLGGSSHLSANARSCGYQTWNLCENQGVDYPDLVEAGEGYVKFGIGCWDTYWPYDQYCYLNVYHGSSIVWSTDLLYGARKLWMTDDGNLIVMNSSFQTLWESGTYVNYGAYLNVQNDGNVVVYRSDDVPLWATNTDF